MTRIARLSIPVGPTNSNVPFISSSIEKGSPADGAHYRRASWCYSRIRLPCAIPRFSAIPQILTYWGRWWVWLCVWIRGSDGVIVPEQLQHRLQISRKEVALNLACVGRHVIPIGRQPNPGGQNGLLVFV